MGVAVAVDDGLIVPVVRDVDQLSASAASTGRSPTSPPGPAPASSASTTSAAATFTIDNTGWFGSNMTMPIINVPEVAHPDHGERSPSARSSSRPPDGDVIAIRPS